MTQRDTGGRPDATLSIRRDDQLSPQQAQASADFLDAQRVAGVTVRPIETNSELRMLERLLDEIWSPAGGQSMVGQGVLRALAGSGNYVAGAFDAGLLVGGCAGFTARTAVPSLHSHIAGVRESLRGRNVGFALKMHQRFWAMQNGYRRVEWTYDPLVRRNAHFNITKLGGRPVDYLPDYYGRMDDRINSSNVSDRVLLRWEVYDAPDPRRLPAPAQRWLVADSDDRPLRLRSANLNPAVAGRLVAVQIPQDIERLRVTSPDVASAWRSAVRETLGSLLEGGARVVSFDNHFGYIVEARP